METPYGSRPTTKGKDEFLECMVCLLRQKWTHHHGAALPRFRSTKAAIAVPELV